MQIVNTCGVEPLTAADLREINGGAEPSSTTSFANDVAYWVCNAAAFYAGFFVGLCGG